MMWEETRGAEIEARDPKWQRLADEVISGMHEWRKQHPKATFTEIESEAMKRTAELQARLIEELVQMSEAATLPLLAPLFVFPSQCVSFTAESAFKRLTASPACGILSSEGYW